MASTQLFDAVPQFPENVPTAEITKTSLSKLTSEDKAEAKTCFEACRILGFFLLDLDRDSVGERMIKEIDSAFSITKSVHDLPLAEKENYPQISPRKCLGKLVLFYAPLNREKNAQGSGDRYKAAGVMKTETG